MENSTGTDTLVRRKQWNKDRRVGARSVKSL